MQKVLSTRNLYKQLTYTVPAPGFRPVQRRCVGAKVQANQLPEALLFDCDGVLVDTERDGHRISFNEAFKRKGAAMLRPLQNSSDFLF